MNFYKQLSEFYDIIFPLNKQSISFITDKISNGPILDLAAGTGNHAIALAEEGYDVTATDLDENMVVKINQKAATKNVTINALQLAMEELDQLEGKRFSTIICIGNSLVHLQNLDDVLAVTTKMNHLLTPNGTLFIQIVNYDRILSEGITELPLIEREQEQITFCRTYKHVDDKIIFNGKLTIGEETYENNVSLLPLTSKQLEQILREANFTSIKMYGSFKGETYKNTSPALIIEASK